MASGTVGGRRGGEKKEKRNGGKKKRKEKDQKLTCHISGKLLIFTRTRRTVSKRTRPGMLGGKNASSRDKMARGDSRRHRRARTAATGFRRVLSGPAIVPYRIVSYRIVVSVPIGYVDR